MGVPKAWLWEPGCGAKELAFGFALIGPVAAQSLTPPAAVPGARIAPSRTAQQTMVDRRIATPRSNSDGSVTAGSEQLR